MSNLKYAKSYRDLLVYGKAYDIAHTVFQVSKQFPKDEIFSLTDQVRRSSRSIGAQIAEAWAKRRYEKHFVSKLTDADAEQMETEHWIHIAASCGYLEQTAAEELVAELNCIGRMLNSMMRKSAKFCQQLELHSR